MRISVAIATCNGADHLEEQLASIVAQTRAADEIVVVDDASDDDTAAIARRMGATRVEVNPQRLGVAGNFTRAISLCTGDVICPADQDDVWLPGKLAEVEAAFAEHPKALAVFADMTVVDADLHETGRTQWQRLGFAGRLREAARRGELFDVLLKFNVVNGAALAFRAELREVVLPVPEGWIHDEWIALLASALGEVRMMERVWVKYRQHGAQQVGPGVTGLRGQWRYARQRMGPSYFEGMERRTRQACERLELAQEHGWKLPTEKLTRLRQRLGHYERRLALRRRARGVRWPTVLRQAWRGEYHRFGYGWKSIAQDLFL
jgi:glycosyltransferase involved in cell wall biosynthesis